MNPGTIVGLGIRFAALFLTFAGVCQRTQAQPTIPFRLLHNKLIVVALMVGEQGPFDFLIDTGANNTTVDPGLARRLSLVPLSHVQAATLTGIQTLTLSSVPSLGTEAARVSNFPVLIQEPSELQRIDSHIEGVVGQDFLFHFNYLLDYRRHLIYIELANEIRDAVGGGRVQIEANGNRMIVASEGQSRRRAKLRLLLDSAANSVVLMRTGSQALDFPPEGAKLDVVSSNGHVRLQVGVVQLLTVGSQQFQDIVVSLSSAEFGGRIGDGLLPTALFQSLYVNNREGFVVFNPRTRKK